MLCTVCFRPCLESAFNIQSLTQSNTFCYLFVFCSLWTHEWNSCMMNGLSLSLMNGQKSALVSNKTEHLLVSKCKRITESLCKRMWKRHCLCFQQQLSTSNPFYSDHNDNITKLDSESHCPDFHLRLPFYTKLSFSSEEINLLSFLLCVHQLLCRTNNIHDFARAESCGKATRLLCGWKGAVIAAGVLSVGYMRHKAHRIKGRQHHLDDQLSDCQPDVPDSTI